MIAYSAHFLSAASIRRRDVSFPRIEARVNGFGDLSLLESEYLKGHRTFPRPCCSAYGHSIDFISSSFHLLSGITPSMSLTAWRCTDARCGSLSSFQVSESTS